MAYQRKSKSKLKNINVKDIRYTQDTISDIFSDGIPIQYTIDMLKMNEIQPEDIEPIRVGRYNKRYFTIDNRRLYCFKQSNIQKIKVKYIVDIWNLPQFHDKYTTQNAGTFIKIRNEHFYCGICCRIMQISDKISHLNGKGHRQNALKYKNTNTQHKTLIIRDEAIDKNTNVTLKRSSKKYEKQVWRTKSNNINNSVKKPSFNNNNSNGKTVAANNKCGNVNQKVISGNNTNDKDTNSTINNINKSVKKPSIIINKFGSDNDNNEKVITVNNTNNKEISNVIPCKPKINNVSQSRESQLEQIIAANKLEINAYEIKFDAMQEQINNYEIKFTKMKQLSNVVIDVDVDLDSKQQYKSENKNKICTTLGFVCGTLSFGAVYILVKKYI